MDLETTLKDGGLKSRKLWVCVFGVLMLAAGWVAAGHWKNLQPEYSTFVGGVIALVGLYYTGNVTTKATVMKAATTSGALKAARVAAAETE